MLVYYYIFIGVLATIITQKSNVFFIPVLFDCMKVLVLEVIVSHNTANQDIHKK